MNKACSFGEDRLVSLLYEGDGADAAEMRAHLATCPGCRAELEELAETKDLLGAWPNVVNAPRMVYVNERAGWSERLRRWADAIARPGFTGLLKPAMAAAGVVVVLAGAVALLDVRVAPDGRLHVGFAGGGPAVGALADAAGAETAGREAAAGGPTTTANLTREEFEDGMAQIVAYMDDLLRSRAEEERRLLMTAIDARLQEQGLESSQRLLSAVAASLDEMDRQHQNDLGLVFSAIDEWSVVTGAELQRTNTILASLLQRVPQNER